MRINSPKLNIMYKVYMKASNLNKRFGEIEKSQVSSKGPGILSLQQIREQKKS